MTKIIKEVNRYFSEYNNVFLNEVTIINEDGSERKHLFCDEHMEKDSEGEYIFSKHLKEFHREKSEDNVHNLKQENKGIKIITKEEKSVFKNMVIQ
jgi:hypothetical protein